MRKGVVSRVNNNDTFYIDGSAFPGNSGSPIFLFPTPVKISNGGISIGAPTKISLLGVMGAYLPYQDVALSQQTGRPRVIFEENTGLSLIWSTKFIDQIIQSEDFQKQIKVIKDSLPKVVPQNNTGHNPVNPNPALGYLTGIIPPPPILTLIGLWMRRLSNHSG